MAELNNQETEQKLTPSVLDEAIKTYFKTHNEIEESQYRLRNSPKDLNDPLIKNLINELREQSPQVFTVIDPGTAWVILSVTPSDIDPKQLGDDVTSWPQPMENMWNETKKVNISGIIPRHVKQFLTSTKQWIAQKEQEIQKINQEKSPPTP